MKHYTVKKCFVKCILLCLVTINIAYANAAELIDRQHFTQANPVVDVALSPDGQSSAILLKTTDQLFELWQLNMVNLTAVKRSVLRQGGELLWFENSQQLLVIAKSSVTQVDMISKKRPRLVAQLKPQDKLLINGMRRAHNLFVSKPSSKKSQHHLEKVLENGNQVVLPHKEPTTGVLLSNNTSSTYRKTMSQDSAEVSQIIDGRERSLFTCSVSTLENPCQLIAKSKDSEAIYVVGRFQSDLSGLYLYTADADKFELIHQDPRGIADIETVLLDSIGQPVMVLYRGLINEWYGLSENAEQVLLSVPQQVIKTVKDIQCSENLTLCLFISESPDKLSRDYYVYRKEQKDIQNIHLHKTLGLQQLEQNAPLDVSVQPLTYKTSDGMTQYGYLYLPTHQALDTTPLVVYPHGGPHTRDYYQSNRFALFLASRGYAVLKPNFRGSTGFGLHYMQSSNNDFGKGRVLEDILDAIDWVKKNGLGVNAPTAIVGESFGGFSAIAAATFDSRFAVAIAAMPALDIGKVRKSLIDRQVRTNDAQRLAFLWGDLNDVGLLSKLHEQSPSNHADLLNTPLYMWAGAGDPIVPVSHIKSYALKQLENGKSISLMIDKQAQHGPVTQQSMLGYMTMMEHVLSRYLNGRAQPVTDVKLKQSLIKMQTLDSSAWLSDYWQQPFKQNTCVVHQHC